MNRFISMLILVLLYAESFSETKDNIAIMELQSNSIPAGDLTGLSNRLSYEIFNIGKFKVVERSRIDEILKEQGFQKSGCTNTECAVEIGQLIGVEKIIVGNIDKVGTVYSVTIRLINVATGMIENVATEDCDYCKLSNILKTTMRKVAEKISRTDKSPQADKPIKPTVMQNNVEIPDNSKTGIIKESPPKIPYKKTKVPKKGLVAYYSFDGDVKDASKFKNNGTMYGTLSVYDRFGRGSCAYKFDGIDDYIKIPHSPSLDITNTLTMSIWILSESNNRCCPHIFGKMEYSEGRWNGSYWIPVRGKSTINWGFAVSPNPSRADNASDNWSQNRFPAKTWTHLAVTFNSDLDEVKMYVNGECVGVEIEKNNLQKNDCDIFIGRNNSHRSGNMRFFNGSLDDIRIYNRVLSETEIQRLYHEGGFNEEK